MSHDYGMQCDISEKTLPTTEGSHTTSEEECKHKLPKSPERKKAPTPPGRKSSQCFAYGLFTFAFCHSHGILVHVLAMAQQHSYSLNIAYQSWNRPCKQQCGLRIFT
eukprot:5845439-Amphidinium_carterae.2